MNFSGFSSSKLIMEGIIRYNFIKNNSFLYFFASKRFQTGSNMTLQRHFFLNRMPERPSLGSNAGALEPEKRDLPSPTLARQYLLGIVTVLMILIVFRQLKNDSNL